MLSTKQKATNFDTISHICKVRDYLNVCVEELLRRGENHDKTKLNNPELDLFVEYTPKLAACTYGSDEYKENLDAIKVALEHHYANNRHHPEYFSNGWKDMTLIDLLEMVCDWMAAVKRHPNGDIQKSLEINRDRFKMPAYLIKILDNTINYIDNLDKKEG